MSDPRNLRQGTNFLAIALALTAIVLRLLWIGDMEWVADQQTASRIITEVGRSGITEVVSAPGNSGVSHSIGFFWFVSLLSGASSDPMTQVRAIALCNALPLALGLWFFRFRPALLLGLAMAATSTSLVMDSRKIWQPDLVSAWTLFSMLVFFAAQMTTKKNWLQSGLFALSGFALIQSGHMYLAGGLFGALGTVAVTYFLRQAEMAAQWRAWLAGCLLGWLTYIPFFLHMWSAHTSLAPHHTASPFNIGHFTYVFEGLLALPTPLLPFKWYLAKQMDQIRAVVPALLVWSILGVFALALLLWVPLYWIAVRRVYSAPGKQADVMVAYTRFLVPATGLALILVRLGGGLSYWLGTLPFVYYTVAWIADQDPRLRRLAWVAVAAQLGFSVLMLGMAHQAGGIPGYAPGYQSTKRLLGPVH